MKETVKKRQVTFNFTVLHFKFTTVPCKRIPLSEYNNEIRRFLCENVHSENFTFFSGT